MPFDLYLAPDFPHHALGIDQKCCTLDTHELAPVHVFFDPDAITLADVSVFVTRECKRQLILCLEVVVPLYAVF